MLSFLQRRHKSQELTAVGVHADGVSVVRASVGVSRPRIAVCDFRLWEGAGDEAKVLGRAAANFGLKHEQCTTVLADQEYKLLLTEAPDVKADELRAALRWRVKDLIDFHINDATLDVFELPGTAAPGTARSMYAVVAQKQVVQQRIALLEGAGVNLQVIDIPELAQRNLAALSPHDANGVVLLSLNAKGGLLTVTKQGELYFSRNIDVGFNALREGARTSDYLDRIVLEVQRSLDYYDSHFRQSPLAHLLIAPLPGEVPGLIDHLNANLGVKASMLELETLLDFQRPVSAETQWRCLSTVGAALRQEVRAL